MLRRWTNKFRCSLRGLWVALSRQGSFYVHVVAAVAVIGLAAWLGPTLVEWLLLVLCITAVFAAELFNTALEHLAKAVTREEHPEVRDALDVASGAVLAVSVGAAVVGAAVLAPMLYG
jgi:diacylglycerol kinase